MEPTKDQQKKPLLFEPDIENKTCANCEYWAGSYCDLPLPPWVNLVGEPQFDIDWASDCDHFIEVNREE